MKLFFIIILCFLSLYGFIQLLMGIQKGVRRNHLEKTQLWHTLICIKDNEDVLEGILRSYSYDECDNVIVVDAGSVDAGEEIARRFAKENHSIHFMKPEEYINFLIAHLPVEMKKI